MEKRIVYYNLTEKASMWSESILNKFQANMSKFGVVYFDEGSEKEAEFINQCKLDSISVNKKTVLKCTGKELYQHPYHYLSVKPLWDRYDINQFMINDNACRGGGDIICKIGAIQKRKIVLDLTKPLNVDIVEFAGVFRPNILLLSKRLKNMMESQGFHGYRLIPCVNKRLQCSEEELLLDKSSNRLNEQATFFQLIVTDMVSNPECVGKVKRIFSQCPTCKTVYGFYSEGTPSFKTGDLKKTDFQRTFQFITCMGDKYDFAKETIIISSRALRFLVENKAKGLFRFMTDPPIKYGVVELK